MEKGCAARRRDNSYRHIGAKGASIAEDREGHGLRLAV